MITRRTIIASALALGLLAASSGSPFARAATLAVQVAVSPTPVIDYQPAAVAGTTTPGASCTVRVVYASGYPATSYSLKTIQTADTLGHVRWGWTPATAYPGPASATVTCSLAGQWAWGSAAFTVV